MRKIDLTMILIFILSLVALITTSVYAWFSLVEKTQPIVIYSGSVDLFVKLSDEDDVEIISEIEIDGFVPGDTYGFYLYLENRGTLDTIVSLNFNFSGTSNDIKEYVVFKIFGDDDLEIQQDLTGKTNLTFNEISELGLTTVEDRDLGNYTNTTYYFEIYIKPSLEYSDLGYKIVLNSITITIEQYLEG